MRKSVTAGCCQTNRNFSPFGRARAGDRVAQAERDCNSASAAERLSWQVCRSMRWRSEAKWLWNEAWTEADI
jgi:hypothetical protein